jgi:hypothetical protein
MPRPGLGNIEVDAVAAATTTVAFGDPVTTSAVATVGGAMETRARRRAERAHREAESGYARGAEDPDITSDKRAAIESEAVHQSHLADRAMRQKQKAAATTLFGAIPGINFMATGAEQTATGIAAEAARKTFEGGKNTKEAVAETLTRAGEAGAGEAETRIVKKVPTDVQDMNSQSVSLAASARRNWTPKR